MKSSLQLCASVSLATLLAAGATHAQEKLPEIEVGAAAPLRAPSSSLLSKPCAQPRAGSSARRRDAGLSPAASSARAQHGAVERDHHDSA